MDRLLPTIFCKISISGSALHTKMLCTICMYVTINLEPFLAFRSYIRVYSPSQRVNDTYITLNFTILLSMRIKQRAKVVCEVTYYYYTTTARAGAAHVAREAARGAAGKVTATGVRRPTRVRAPQWTCYAALRKRGHARTQTRALFQLIAAAPPPTWRCGDDAAAAVRPTLDGNYLTRVRIVNMSRLDTLSLSRTAPLAVAAAPNTPTFAIVAKTNNTLQTVLFLKMSKKFVNEGMLIRR